MQIKIDTAWLTVKESKDIKTVLLGVLMTEKHNR
jgi:hypothetical protein